MSHRITIQHASTFAIPVPDSDIRKWVRLALTGIDTDSELTLRLADKAEIHNLNQQWRNLDKPTNVLAFPSELPPGLPLRRKPLGDIVIAPEVLQEESTAMGFRLREHWAHTVIHGVLHLLGHDHIETEEAHIMQQAETRLMADLGFSNPWEGQPS